MPARLLTLEVLKTQLNFITYTESDTSETMMQSKRTKNQQKQEILVKHQTYVIIEAVGVSKSPSKRHSNDMGILTLYII